MRVLGKSLACGLAAALLAGQIGVATAAPLPTNISAMKSAVERPTQVYWRGGWGWGWGAGAIAGALIGGAIASGAYGYYGGPAYYYGYGYPYAYPYPYTGYYAPYYGYYTPYYAYPRYRYYARPYGVHRRGYVRHHHYRHR